MPIIGSEKLTMFVLVGGVSEIVRLSALLPPPPQLVVQTLFNPLHELRVRTARKAINTRDFLEFMQHPTTELGRPHQTDRTLGIPKHTVALGLKAHGTETAELPNY